MIDYSDEPGFPATSTRVYRDPSRIGPHVMRQDFRLDQQEADRKWRAANREQYLAAARERARKNYWKRRGVAL